jgi:protein phosphatase
MSPFAREPALKRIFLPDPALVLLIGPSGAGKSTFAAAHFRPTQIVSSDALRAVLTDDAGDQGASAEAFRLLAIIVSGRLRRRLTTVVDAINLRAVDRRRYAALAARYGLPTVAIAFDLSLETYHARNRMRPDRVVATEILEDQAARMERVLVELPTEGYMEVRVLDETGQSRRPGVERQTLP